LRLHTDKLCIHRCMHVLHWLSSGHEGFYFTFTLSLESAPTQPCRSSAAGLWA
jgi:hypothetical protein